MYLNLYDMQSNLYKFGILGFISFIYIYKYYNAMKKYNYNLLVALKYKVEELDNYTISTNSRIYKYNAKSSMFHDLESKYKESLFGNYKKKEHIDNALKDYLSHQTIHQKHVIINTEGYVMHITIDANIEDKYLVFDIFNNSLEESKMDGIIIGKYLRSKI